MGKVKTPVFSAEEKVDGMYLDEKFLRKKLRIGKKVSGLKMAMINKFVGMYNNFFGTKFFIHWLRVGESNTYQVKEIENKTKGDPNQIPLF